MNIKQTILSLTALLLLTACSSDLAPEQRPSVATPDGEDLVPVEFSVSEGYNPTRAATDIVSFTSGEAVKVCVSTNGGTNYTGYDFTTAAAGQNVGLSAPTSGAKPYFPTGSGTSVKAYAYYPSTAGEAATFSVAANQVANGDYKASDLMFAKNRTITKGVTDENNNLSMIHLMAQLHLNVTATGLTVNRVLVNAKRTVSFTPAAGAAVTTGLAADIVAAAVATTNDDASDIVAATDAGQAFVCIPVQPINDVTIKIETGAQGDAATTATFTFTSTDNFVAGNSYPISLTISAAQLGATSAITDWNGMESVTVGSSGDLDVEPISAVTYNGSAQTPSLTVKKGSATLTAGTDYDVEWHHNTTAGTAIAVILGKSTYLGSVAVAKFTINPKPLTDVMVPSISAQTYTRSQITPAVTVTDGSALTQNTDYTISYGENVNAGTNVGSVTVTGKGNYTGEVVKNFTINPKNISSMTLTLDQDGTAYTGNPITASVSSLKDGSYTLLSGTEYTVDGTSVTSATDAAANASASVTQNTIKVNGEGNYTGSKSATWSIARATPTLTISSYSPNPMNLTKTSPTGTINVTRSGDGTVTATSSASEVASTSVTGTTVTVTANKNGTATITVKMNQGKNYSAYTNADRTVSVSTSGFIDVKKNPLWWVAQYNMASNKTSFVTSHSTSSQYCFNFTDAAAENISGYHLPTWSEQISVIPSDNSSSNGTNIFGMSGTVSSPVSYSEQGCTVGGTSVSGSTSYWGGSGNDWYAVRFIGTNYASAWHYKWVTSPCNGLLIESYLVTMADENAAKNVLKNLPSSTIFTSSANASTANQTPANTDETTNGFVQRFLPACGYRYNSGGGGSGTADNGQGSHGGYWSATEKDSSGGWRWYFDSSYLFEGGSSLKYGFSVRLFRDN